MAVGSNRPDLDVRAGATALLPRLLVAGGEDDGAGGAAGAAGAGGAAGGVVAGEVGAPS